MPKKRRFLASRPFRAFALLPLLPGNAWASFECSFDCVDRESGAALGRKAIRSGGIIPHSEKRPADDHGAQRATLMGVLTASMLRPTIPLVKGNSSSGDLTFSLRRLPCGELEEVFETLDWMLLPVGRARNGDGEAYEAGVTTLNSGWTEVLFTEELPAVPVVVVSPGSVDTWVMPRIDNVTTSGFWARLQGERGGPLEGSLSWLALPEGNSTLMNLSYQARWQSGHDLMSDLPDASPLFFAGLTFEKPQLAYLRLKCNPERKTFSELAVRQPACNKPALNQVGRVAVLILQPPRGLSARSNEACAPLPTMYVAASIILSVLFYGSPCAGCAMRKTKWRRHAWALTLFTMGLTTMIYWLWLEPTDGFTWRDRMDLASWGFYGFIIAWGVGLLVNVPLCLLRWRRSRLEGKPAKSTPRDPASKEAKIEEDNPALAEQDAEDHGDDDGNSRGV